MRRLSQVLERLIEAQRHGERLPEAVLEDYAEQLTRVIRWHAGDATI